MGNAIVAKSDNKSQVLGDDPLAWLNAGKASGKKVVKKKSVTKKKAASKKKGISKAKTENDKSKKETKTKSIESAKVGTAAVKKTSRLELESSLVINKANDFHETLKKLSANGQDVEIDASKVEIIDSAILQLILSFIISLKNKGLKSSWHKPTENLLDKASVLGLTDDLGL